MKEEFRRGFKEDAERLSLEIRAELGLGPHDRLDPEALANHLGIPALPLSALEGAAPWAVQHLMGRGSKEFSAVTLTVGTQRLIVYNPNHSAGRQASSLAHELAHVLLDHEPVEAVGDGGCRRWDQRMEDEADWLAGVLLVPRDAAHQVALRGVTTEDGAAHFGVSVPMMRWRLNKSGALARAQARSRLGYGGFRPRTASPS